MHAMKLRRRASALVVAALGVVALGGTALAGHIGSGVKSYTGCLTPGEGVLIKIKEGNAPSSACSGAQVQVHFSGGDITAVAAQAGGGLAGGGDNGAVSLSLLRSCSNGQVLKWNGTAWGCANDDSTQYTAGAGLDLTGNEFSIERTFQLPQGCELGEAAGWGISGAGASIPGWVCRQYTKASETCPTGQFARATSSAGGLVCAAPSAGGAAGAALEARQANFADGDGVPDDDAFHDYVTLSLPSGTYAVVGKGVLRQGDDDIGFVDPNGMGCQLANGAQTVDESAFTPKDNQADNYGFSLTGIVTTTTGGTVVLRCRAEDDADLVSIRYGHIVALKVG